MVSVNSSFLFPSLLWILCLDSEIMDSKSTSSPMEMPPRNRLSILPRCHFRAVGTQVWGSGHVCSSNKWNQSWHSCPSTPPLGNWYGPLLWNTGSGLRAWAQSFSCGKPKDSQAEGVTTKDTFKPRVTDYLPHPHLVRLCVFLQAPFLTAVLDSQQKWLRIIYFASD